MLYRQLAFAAATSLLLAACHEQATHTTTAPAIPGGPRCYAYATAKATVHLTLTTAQPTVTGQLSYRYAEKDGNEGTIRGAMHGDTLRADYTFQSEGTSSVRQVAFLRRDIGFIKAYGPVAERAGKTVYILPAPCISMPNTRSCPWPAPNSQPGRRGISGWRVP